MAEPLKISVPRRLQDDGRWKQVAPLRDQMIDEAEARGMTRDQAKEWTYQELDRLYPPITVGSEGNNTASSPGDALVSPGAGAREGIVIPESWPELPPNAPLAVELAWVQAERLRVVEERVTGQSVVRLEKARSPAPSMSALSWLETSIRSYAKYVEVAAKAAGAAEDDSDQVARERSSLNDVRSLLSELVPG